MALLCSFALGALAVIFLPYLAFHIVLSLLPPRNLRQAYDAQWGLVTGSSSGVPPAWLHTHRDNALQRCRVGCHRHHRHDSRCQSY